MTTPFVLLLVLLDIASAQTIDAVSGLVRPELVCANRQYCLVQDQWCDRLDPDTNCGPCVTYNQLLNQYICTETSNQLSPQEQCPEVRCQGSTTLGFHPSAFVRFQSLVPVAPAPMPKEVPASAPAPASPSLVAVNDQPMNEQPMVQLESTLQPRPEAATTTDSEAKKWDSLSVVPLYVVAGILVAFGISVRVKYKQDDS